PSAAAVRLQREPERRQAEHRREGVEGAEMGELDVEDRQRHQERAEQPGERSKEPATDEEDEEDAHEVEGRGETAAGEGKLAVVVVPREVGERLAQEEREGAVDE